MPVLPKLVRERPIVCVAGGTVETAFTCQEVVVERSAMTPAVALQYAADLQEAALALLSAPSKVAPLTKARKRRKP
jgi:hypothetical protein